MKKKRLSKVLALLIAIAILFGMMPSMAFAGSDDSTEQNIISQGIAAAQGYWQSQDAEQFSTVGGEWYYFDLIQSGSSIDPANVNTYLDAVKTAYSGTIPTDSSMLEPTTLARVILTVSALGEDAENIGDVNLVQMLYNSSRIGTQGNYAIWALLALDCRSFSIPSEALWNRENLMNEILAYQKENGGFAWNSKEAAAAPDLDITAMAIQALAPYYQQTAVKTAVDQAISYMQGQMDINCQFGSSEASSQVLIALAALYKDPLDPANGFTNGVKNLFTGLDAYRVPGEGFKHALSESVNRIATDQALRALEACRRFYASENSLYDLTDVTLENIITRRIAEAGSLDQDNYNADLWNTMITAKNNAQTLLTNGASQTALKEADDALAAALAALHHANPFPETGGKNITVYVTIAAEGNLKASKDGSAMGNMEVSVADRNRDGQHDIGEVLYAVHETCYDGGAAAGYAQTEDAITKVWGIGGDFNARVNDTAVSLTDIVTEQDYISVYESMNGFGKPYVYTALDKRAYTAGIGETVVLTLQGDFGSGLQPYSGANIYRLGSEELLGTTDSDGKVSLTFAQEETCKVMARTSDGMAVPSVAAITIRSQSVLPQEKVYLRVADPSGKVYLEKRAYDFREGETAYSILENSGLRIESRYEPMYESVYVSAIEGLAEFDKGAGSGWMYRVNGVYPDYGCSAYRLKAGDYVEWLYTSDLGNDIGGGFAGAVEESQEVTTSGTSGSATTTTPTEVTVSGSTATATVKSENAAEAIKQAQENKSTEIVLNVAAADTKGAETVKVQLDTATVKSVVSDTDASLTVKTENGQVSLDREALSTIASEAKGTTITLEVTKVDKPTETQQKAAGTNGQVLQLVVKSGDKILSDFNKGKATVTVEIPAKLQDKKVAAIYIADDGQIEQMSGKTVKIDGKDYYSFGTPHFSTFALVDAEELGLEVTDEEQAKLEKLISGVENTTLKASSKKAANGIKITWTKSKGYRMDYYEVFRSTKRYSGFGKTAFFSTKNTSDP
ncbi:MAG: DUF4430 domain-containing protein, partial [Anaerovoracaceae bacterium]